MINDESHKTLSHNGYTIYNLIIYAFKIQNIENLRISSFQHFLSIISRATWILTDKIADALSKSRQM